MQTKCCPEYIHNLCEGNIEQNVDMNIFTIGMIYIKQFYFLKKILNKLLTRIY